MQEPLTSEEIARVDAAMEACNGDRGMVAGVLECERARIHFAIQNHDGLRSKWGREDEVALGKIGVDLATRELPQETTLTREEQHALALRAQEKKFSKALAKLGFKEKEIQTISAAEQFAGRHFKSTLSMMHGGVIKSAARLMLLSEHLEQTYLMRDDLDKKDRDFYWSSYFKILEQLRNFSQEANRSAITRALINVKEKGKEGKPGLSSAIQVNVNTGPQPAKVETKLPQGWKPPPAPDESI